MQLANFGQLHRLHRERKENKQKKEIERLAIIFQFAFQNISKYDTKRNSFENEEN